MKQLLALLALSISLDAAAQNVGVGTTTPVEKLTVAGNIKADTIKPTVIKLITDAGEGKILTSDAAGNASWRTNAATAGSSVGFGAWGDCATNQAISEYNPVSNGLPTGGFGNSVSISGDYAIIGSWLEDVGTNNGQGAAYIYHFDGTNWVLHQKITDPAGEVNDNFGQSVAISGSFIIVSSYRDDVGALADAGSVLFYRLIGNSWVYQSKFTNGVGGDWYGSSIALDGNYLAVGVPKRTVGADNNQGAIVTYRFDGTNWVMMNTLTDALGEAEDELGYSVSISGDYLAAGTADGQGGGDSRGVAVTWRRVGTSWILMQRFTGMYNLDRLGRSVSISGDIMAIGIPGYDPSSVIDQGVVAIYQRTGTTWNFLYQMENASGAAGDAFGDAVAMTGNYLMVGSQLSEVNGNNAQGNVTLYQKMGGGFQRLQLITDPAGEPNDAFGGSVALDANKRYVVAASGYLSLGKVIFGKIN